MATARSRTAYEDITIHECKEWAKKPEVNPVTGKKIRKDTKQHPNVYDKIAKACAKYGIVPQASTIQDVLHTKVQGHAFPMSSRAWLDVAVKITLILDRTERAHYIVSYDLNYYIAMATHFANAQKYDVFGYLQNKEPSFKWMPLRYKLEGLVMKLGKVNKLPRRESPLATTLLNTQVWQVISSYIETGAAPDSSTLAKLLEQAQTWQVYYAEPGADELVQKILDTQEIIESMALEKLEHNVVQEDEEIPESRLRSTPSSITPSQTSTPSRKYSASYKRHSKLSQLSAPSKLEDLPKKTRQQLLKELKQACTVMKDTITYERFDRMNKKNLMLIVRLGKGDANQHCFYVRNIYTAWKQAVKDNKPFVDPLNGMPVTGEEKDDIMRKMRYIKQDVKDPRDIQQKIPKAIELVFTPVSHKDADGIATRFYEVSVRTKKKYGSMVILIMRLGYIPADIEPEDMGGSLNLSSAVLVSHIKKLFDSGRLLTSNSVPYRCCRVHLRKPIDYWLDPEGPRGIHERRFTMMVEEIERYL